MDSLYSAEECERIAREASLRYVSDSLPGITRKRCGKGFAFYNADKTLIRDPATIQRIRKLGIPPAYKDVWISPYPNSHIQAIGRDEKNRKQYLYHPQWREIRNQKKFATMIDFGKALPKIRAHVQQKLSQPLTLEKSQMICAIIYLLDNVAIRIGNSTYAKQNKSYGLTTLRKKHLSIEKNTAILDFNGKNNQLWHVILKDKKIVRILQKCEEIPGYELFKYIDEEGKINTLTSQDVNNYLKFLTQKSFTAKDFRTWTACKEAFCRLHNQHLSENKMSLKNVKEVIKEVAKILGHTPSICKKNYIDPDILTWWESSQFEGWLKKCKHKNCDDLEATFLKWLRDKTKIQCY
jgi:DNA topoisomerase-1